MFLKAFVICEEYPMVPIINMSSLFFTIALRVFNSLPNYSIKLGFVMELKNWLNYSTEGSIVAFKLLNLDN